MNLRQISILVILIAVTIAWLTFSLETIHTIIELLLDIEFEALPKIQLLPEYDFIVIGAGTAGCALANRLSENAKWNVLLVEAGQSENIIMDIPVFVYFMQKSDKLNWQYKSERSESYCLAMNNNQCKLPRGKVMGGSSVLNYMMYSRGNKKDFDDWEKMGNTGWSFDDVLPYFKKLENYRIPNSDPNFYGSSGPVPVSYANFQSVISEAFIDAMKELGLAETNYNGKKQVGVSRLQTTTKDGYRVSSNRAYIDPVRSRPNLHIQTGALVTKILIDDVRKVATGVEFYHDNKWHTVNASKEVIVSAGAINSPQLLMLSGVGPSDHLSEKGIKTIADLPVGQNLMDHVAFGFIYTVSGITTPKQEVETLTSAASFMFTGTGAYATVGGLESVAFFDSNNFSDPDAYPNIEIMQISGCVHDTNVMKLNFNYRDDIYEKFYRSLEDRKTTAFALGVFTLQPKSRGVIKLNDTDPFKHPLINPNYYSDPRDMQNSIKAIEKILLIEKTEGFKRLNATHYITIPPACKHLEFPSDSYWECYIRHVTQTIYHYVGTCKMGQSSDTSAVVDPRLRVLGIKHLRVADASIMPNIVSGHTNAVVFMIAEKAADMIKEDWNGL